MEAAKRETREIEGRHKTLGTKTKGASPLVSLTKCRQLIEINVLSGWADGTKRFRLAARELDA